MKAEITPENKAKFLAQYWGQNIFHWKYPEHAANENVITNIDEGALKYAKCGSILLKPLSSLFDEDVIGAVFMNGIPEGWELYKVYTLAPTAWFSVKLRRRYGESDHSFNEDGYEYKDHFLKIKGSPLSSWSTDYLRSKGYAVDWMGLTVAEMVEAGWIKLIKS